MKARIDGHGNLAIERAGKLMPQFCPQTPGFDDGDSRSCGDWCPLFSEVTTSIGGDASVRTVMLTCSPLVGVWHEITADARPKAESTGSRQIGELMKTGLYRLVFRSLRYLA